MSSILNLCWGIVKSSTQDESHQTTAKQKAVNFKRPAAATGSQGKSNTVGTTRTVSGALEKTKLQ